LALEVKTLAAEPSVTPRASQTLPSSFSILPAMAAKKQPAEQVGMSRGDPRLPLKIARLRDARAAITSLSAREPRLEDPEFEEWESNVQELLKEVFGGSGYLLRFRQLNIRPITYAMGGGRRWYAEPNQAWSTGLPQADKILAEAIEEAEVISGGAPNQAMTPPPQRAHGNKVFIVHGHDEGARETVARFLERLEVDAIVLHEKPTQGRTVVEKLEHYADVDFAVVLLTPDDVGRSENQREALQARARQNVILELGYFVGRLGRKKVCALYKGPLELPSDYLGVVYVPLDTAGGWRFQLAKELKSAGFTVDMNLAL
jgi:predicted nucleotide-binding protein